MDSQGEECRRESRERARIVARSLRADNWLAAFFPLVSFRTCPRVFEIAPHRMKIQTLLLPQRGGGRDLDF